jgi:2,4-dienoyl-CoA reductase-like NADH-dependent reductase (Old Yellow Enzyme family)
MSNESGMLFSPIAIGSLTIAGRLIKTATAETRASEDGFVTDDVLEFYRPIALGGTPLIITGNIYVSRDGKSSPRQLGADADDKIEGLARLTALVHEHGCCIFGQLNHCGRQVLPPAAGLSEAVSASAKTELMTGTRPRALTGPEL